MSMLKKTVSQLLLSQLVSFCMRRGWIVDDVFRQAGYDLAQLRVGQRLLTQDDFLPLLLSISKQKHMPDIALKLGHEIHSEQLGVFGALVSSSANLTAAVHVFSQFNALLDDRFQLHLKKRHDTLWLVYESGYKPVSQHPFYTELLFSAVAAHANQFSRLDSAPLSIEFAHAAPNYSASYADHFTCPVAWSKTHNQMQLPTHAANTPFTTQNTRYHAHALAEAKKLLPNQSASRTEQVRAYLQTHVADASACQLDAVSCFLQCSSRTLQRELQAENTSLKQLLDDTRRLIACDQLTNTNARIESIGQAVGFEYPSSFTAKFKQWTGQTPRQFREQ